MARKNTLIYQVVTDQPLDTNFETVPTSVEYLDNCSYQIDITTTDSEGAFTLEGSNNYAINQVTGVVANLGTWVPIDLGSSDGTQPSVEAANDQIMIHMNQLPFLFIRLKYVGTTPGTGTVAIVLNCRQVGG